MDIPNPDIPNPDIPNPDIPNPDGADPDGADPDNFAPREEKRVRDETLPSPTDVLPHAPPVVFMDRIVHADDTVTTTEWRVPEASPWVVGGTLLSSALVEVAAQTAAAGFGILALRAGVQPTPGVLGTIRHFEIHREVRSGDLLRSTVELRFEVAGAVLVRCSIVVGDGELVAEGDLGLVPNALA